MTLREAFARELDREKRAWFPPKLLTCRLCQLIDYRHAGVCFKCQHQVETDLVEVWEVAHPENRWPYVWTDLSEEEKQKLEYAEEHKEDTAMQLALFKFKTQAARVKDQKKKEHVR
jgi:hypothetical protein